MTLRPEDPFDLNRFLVAQDRVYERVRSELTAGRKESHWMWFVFPQLAGLGSSPTAQRYAIRSREEAKAYLDHPLLGARLRECTALVNAVERRSIEEIFGYPDHLKFRSCMTLFAAITSGDRMFQQALDRYFGGEPDPRTMALLGER